MLPGFIPHSRASFTLDLIATAMLVVVPALAWSLRVARVHGNHALHGRIQVALGGLLLIVVLLFEVEMRRFGWRHLARPSVYYGTLLEPVLRVHLCCAISATLLWAWTLFGALRHFAWPPRPSAYGPRHKRVARVAALSMFITAITGWTFYWMAFVS